ncbi:hypothetical protein BCR36DRAFT_315112 [Piromyces finnis]|uniref:Peptidase M48 domain-containing protein n=1 Tax=Piromyces finnis TaxID=1754191 RepID=A0A1Y1VQ51_9FUNG|nr:hypothetical protein BCR36DRAFT_315112 [Piromyces finnis]|eukprot:ORX61001.1 hypothetical protein BCR36DRAFT_315112 [Piromyces finnis]
MSFSIINNSLKKSYLNKNIQQYSLPLIKSSLKQYSTLNKVVLINNSTRNLNLNSCNLLHTSPCRIISSLAELKENNSVSKTNCNYLFKKEFTSRRFYSSFYENDKEDGNQPSNLDKEERDQPSDTNKDFSSDYFSNAAFNKVDNDFNKESVSGTMNSNSRNINNNNNNNINENENENEKNNENKENNETTKDEVKEFYNKLRDSIVDKLNRIPSTLEKASTFKFEKENLEKLSAASPYLLWTSFIFASSLGAFVFKQITGSTIISNAVKIGIDFPAIVNVSHLYNQGGKMIVKELGAEKCPATSELCEIVEAISKEINLDSVPDVYIHPSEEINGLTGGIKNDNSVILITRGLLNNLKPDEIRAIIAHMLYHKKANFTSLGTHLTAMVSGFYAPYNFGRYIRNYLIECKKKKSNSLLLDIAIGVNSIFIFLTKILNGFCYLSQSAFVRFRERQSLPKQLMTDSWKSAIRKLYNQPESVSKESLITFNPAFSHLFLCDGKGEGWNKAANMAGTFDKDIQNGKIWTKKNVRSVTEYFSIFPSLKKRIEWIEPEEAKEKEE